MNTLKLLGSPDAKEVLCSRLESPNWGIQQQAAEALAEIPFDGKVELLGEALLDQKTHARLRATLAELLGDITTDESLNCLLKAFPLVDGMAQTAVVVALSKLKDPRASSELAKLAESSSAPLDNRLAAIDALATVGAPDSIVTLTSLAESPTESHLIRGHCIVGLKELRAIASLPCLLKIAENEEEHVPLRVAALDAMSGLDAPELIAVARKLMGHDDPRLRLSAVYALGKMGDHTSFHEISKWALAEGESESTRIACLRALLDMDETIAGELIVSHFETLPIDCKCDIVKYMGEKELSSAVDFFINLANSPDTAGDTRLQIRSIAALSKLRDHHVVQARLRILRDPQKNEHVRVASAEALGEQKPLVDPQWLGGEC
jgi:HEAT repeat protein